MTIKTEPKGFFEEINPPALDAPRGFSHGLIVEPHWRLLFVAGQTAATVDRDVGDGAFVSQFTEALDRTLAVVRAAGGSPQHVVRMTIYVTDIEAYRASRSRLNDVWRERMGRHYPAMALVGVTELVDRNATVEIEATAALPPVPR